VEAILQAAVAEFALCGYARTTTNRIAERTGVSIGSLYQYFPNKDAILAALHERHLASVEAVIGHGLSELPDPRVPLERSFRRLLGALREVHEADPKLTAVVSWQAPQTRLFGASLRKHGQGRVDRVEAILRGRPDVRTGDRTVMAHLLVVAMEGLKRWVAHELPDERYRRVAIEEVAIMLARYLQQ
jgi:AcrR family transcriptional regulator